MKETYHDSFTMMGVVFLLSILALAYFPPLLVCLFFMGGIWFSMILAVLYEVLNSQRPRRVKKKVKSVDKMQVLRNKIDKEVQDSLKEMQL